MKMETNPGDQLKHEQLQNDRHRLNVMFGIVVLALSLLFALAAGIIFLNKDTRTGLLILSHAAAAVIGWIIAGGFNVKGREEG